MSQVWVRLYEELNEYLPSEKRKLAWACPFTGEISVATLLRSIGVPLGEVDLILRNGESVGPLQVIQDRDRISVYPVFESLDIKTAARVREEPLRRPSFIVDRGLERLAFHLRLSGFDVLTRTGLPDEHSSNSTEPGDRILLIRADQQVPDVSHCFRVHSGVPRCQAEEVIARLDLRRLTKPFSRCPLCNAPLKVGVSLDCSICSSTGTRSARLRRIRRILERS